MLAIVTKMGVSPAPHQSGHGLSVVCLSRCLAPVQGQGSITPLAGLQR